MGWLDGFIQRRGGRDAEMSFLEHLEELRWHIIRSLLAIIIVGIVLFLNKSFVFDQVILAPKNPQFWTYRMMCRLGDLLHWKSLCTTEISFTLTNIDLSAPFMIHLQIAFVLGLVFTFPYIFWEFWKFVKPALFEGEQKQAGGAVFAASLLFYLGVLFGYYLIVPFTVNFLGSYQVSEEVKNNINLSSYIDTVTGLSFSCGLVFEFPLLIYFLAKVGLTTHELLSQYRKMALVVILLIAAVITPSPDMFSQTLVAVPLYGLFEIGIIISRKVAANRKLVAENESADDTYHAA
ncbi:MAG: twin-arginine translocase subunit TatC [Chitinophagales bacterium]|nr:twin-arginine translocase subunit TatC [Chitinophagales bacterium]